MIALEKITAFLDEILVTPEGCSDASNNGLQVEACSNVYRIVFAVDASLELFWRAAEQDADLIVVHHGISWGDGFGRVTGPLAARIEVLFKKEISLYASHLPLDIHPGIGNNAVIAQRIGLEDAGRFAPYSGVEIGVEGMLPREIALRDFQQFVSERLETEAEILPSGSDSVRHVGVVSGAGGSCLEACPDAGVDCFLTGEISHSHVHTAGESQVNVVTAGHYRTEVWGVRSLQERVETEFKVECSFLDLPTGY